MRSKVSIIITLCAQMVAQQGKMRCFLRGHLKPVSVEFQRQAAESVNGIQCKIDGVEFDMCKRVYQCCAAFGCGKFAFVHGQRGNHFRLVGAAWHGYRHNRS